MGPMYQLIKPQSIELQKRTFRTYLTTLLTFLPSSIRLKVFSALMRDLLRCIAECHGQLYNWKWENLKMGNRGLKLDTLTTSSLLTWSPWRRQHQHRRWADPLPRPPPKQSLNRLTPKNQFRRRLIQFWRQTLSTDKQTSTNPPPHTSTLRAGKFKLRGQSERRAIPRLNT